MSLAFVGSSGPDLRNAQRNSVPLPRRLVAMKSRFLTPDRRATWRERFVAIARQVDSAAAVLPAQRDLRRPRLRTWADRLAART